MPLNPAAAFFVGAAISSVRSAVRNARSRVYSASTLAHLDSGAGDIQAWMKQVSDSLDQVLSLYPEVYKASADLRDKFGPVWNSLSNGPPLSIELLRQGLDGLCEAVDRLVDHIATQVQDVSK